MIFNIAFTIFIIFMVICITIFTEKGLKAVAVSFTCFIIMFTAVIVVDLTEGSVKQEAVENNAAHWVIKINTITGNSTKEFKWGPPPNKPNEGNKLTNQQDNEVNEVNETPK